MKKVLFLALSLLGLFAVACDDDSSKKGEVSASDVINLIKDASYDAKEIKMSSGYLGCTGASLGVNAGGDWGVEASKDGDCGYYVFHFETEDEAIASFDCIYDYKIKGKFGSTESEEANHFQSFYAEGKVNSLYAKAIYLIRQDNLVIFFEHDWNSQEAGSYERCSGAYNLFEDITEL